MPAYSEKPVRDVVVGDVVLDNDGCARCVAAIQPNLIASLLPRGNEVALTRFTYAEHDCPHPEFAFDEEEHPSAGWMGLPG